MASRARSGIRVGVVLTLVLGFAGVTGMMTRPASAQVTTQDLAGMCQGHTGNPEVGLAMCNMYIAGVTDMHFYALYETGQRFFCFSEQTVTGEDVRKAFLDWVAKHPDMIHQSARYTLIEAMISAYPCK